MPRVVHSAVVIALSSVLAGSGARAAPGSGESGLTPDGRPAPPVIADHRCRLFAAIRPLLFWIGRGNVGSTRIVWRDDGNGSKGYELLLGSDPGRAPRQINRWGFAREDVNASGATTVGVMNRSEDGPPPSGPQGLHVPPARGAAAFGG